LMAAAASSGGTFRESWALAKAFTEARQQHGESELLSVGGHAKTPPILRRAFFALDWLS
jgi:hypothetical protein